MLLSPDFVADDPSQGGNHGVSLSTPHQVGISPIECWYSGVVNQSGYASQAQVLNAPLMYPVVIGRSGIIDQIACEVTVGGGAGSRVRCGIYSPTSKYNIYPNALIVDGGDFDATVVSTKVTAINVYLVAGLYWFIVNTGVATPSLRFAIGNQISPVLGVSSVIGANPSICFGGTLIYGALPTIFPTPAAIGGSLTTSNVPVVHVRFSR